MKRLPPSQCPSCPPPASWELASIGLTSRPGAGGERRFSGHRVWNHQPWLAASVPYGRWLTTRRWILRSDESKTTAEAHDYLDERTGVLAAMLAKRAPGYAGLGFSDPRKLALTPSASTDS